VFACTKWDALKDRADPEGLRLLSYALRWLAHSNAAHLVYLGGLQPAGSTAAGRQVGKAQAQLHAQLHDYQNTTASSTVQSVLSQYRLCCHSTGCTGPTITVLY
jgi:hypothetical protein